MDTNNMKHRFALYGFGFAIGILLVIFFLGGKKAACNWMPNDRMLKIIRSKDLQYSSSAFDIYNTSKVDSTDISQILINGEINFSKSNVKNNPCRRYLINGANQQKDISLQIQLCDSIATVQEILFKEIN